jgi:hypothetical protein
MSMTHAPTSPPQLRSSQPHTATPGDARPISLAGAPAVSSELMHILDDLVDAIDVREAYEPEGGGWDTAHAIRRLERELARTWAAVPRSVGPASASRRWQP